MNRLLEIQQTIDADIESLVALRIEAMRPSLKAVGRFDPQRARERFLANYSAENTYKVLSEGQLVAFFVWYIDQDYIWLSHLYVDPLFQGNKVGEFVIEHIKAIAKQENRNIRLRALKQSRANHFYQKLGFIKIEEEEWDFIYQWVTVDS